MTLYSLYDEKRDAYIKGEANYESRAEAQKRLTVLRKARGHDGIVIYLSKDFIPGLTLK